MQEKRPTTQLTPPPSSVLAAVKAKGRPVGGAPPVRIPPLDAEPIEGGGTMEQQARVLSDPASPLSPNYNPELAHVQPVMRTPVRPQPEPTDGTYRPKLSQGTVEGLDAIKKFQAETEATQRRIAQETEVKAPETAGNSNIDELRTLFGDDTQWSVLNNPARRKAIEARLTPLDIADILVHGEVRQDIPIVPDKLTISVRSVNGAEDLAVKQLMTDESGVDRYLVDKFSLMGVALGLVAINGSELPTHLNKDKEFDKELFKHKFTMVLRYPMTLLADFGLQLFWFDKRVQALFSDQTAALKNS